jgi:hypothetical protein
MADAVPHDGVSWSCSMRMADVGYVAVVTLGYVGVPVEELVITVRCVASTAD